MDYDTGFIAEEVNAINPIFNEYSNGQLTGVKYSQLTALLTKSVQQLDVQVQDHESRIESLEAAVFDSNFIDLTVTGTATIENLTVTGTTEVAELRDQLDVLTNQMEDRIATVTASLEEKYRQKVEQRMEELSGLATAILLRQANPAILPEVLKHASYTV